jgi:hypothetical protein
VPLVVQRARFAVDCLVGSEQKIKFRIHENISTSTGLFMCTVRKYLFFNFSSFSCNTHMTNAHILIFFYFKCSVLSTMYFLKIMYVQRDFSSSSSTFAASASATLALPVDAFSSFAVSISTIVFASSSTAFKKSSSESTTSSPSAFLIFA